MIMSMRKFTILMASCLMCLSLSVAADSNMTKKGMMDKTSEMGKEKMMDSKGMDKKMTEEEMMKKEAMEKDTMGKMKDKAADKKGKMKDKKKMY